MSTESLSVLMTADAAGGVWTYSLDLARGLAEAGLRTTLAVLGAPPSVDQRAIAATVPGLAVVETGLPLDWTAETPDDVLRAGGQLAGLAEAVRADLVHLNSPAFAAGGDFDRPVLGVCHSCVATWWDAVRTGPLPPDLAWRADLVRRGYEASNALVAPSASFAAATAAAYGLAALPQVVFNGRLPASSSASGQAGTGRPAERAVFTAGRLWDDGKNVVVLDRAAARLSVPVLAAGPTRGPNGTEVSLRHAHPLGLVSDDVIAAQLTRQPVFVSAARYEPFGLAVLEAAQAGCPLVLSDIPTFRELWDGAALFVPPDDDAYLADAIEGLLSNRRRADEFGRSARARSEVYRVDAMVAGTLAAYRSLRAGRAAAA